MPDTRILTAVIFGVVSLAAYSPRIAQAQDNPAAESFGSISGRVFRMDTGAVVPKAHVTLVLETKSNSLTNVQTVLTGEDGGYRFDRVGPGTYLVEAERDGFLENGYGAVRTHDAFDWVTLVAGEVKKDIDVRLEATSVISGNVVDEDGAPVKKLAISAVRIQFSTSGEYIENVQTGETDDLGNFRILDLQPGPYYVAAGFLVGGPRAGNITYGQTFYPGTRTLDSAQQVFVAPGSETPGINIAVAPVESYRVNGKLVDSTTHGDVVYSIRLLREAGDSPLSAWPVWTGGPSEIHADGSFVIRNVPSGDYTIKVVSRSADPPKPLIGPTHVGRENAGTTSIKVGDADVPVEVDISSPTVVRGDIEFEDTNRKEFKGFRVSLIPEVTFGSVLQVKLNDDGVFDFQNILPEHYVVSVMHPPKMNVYVKSVRCGGGGQSVQRLNAEPGTVNRCTINVADDAGTLSGQVKDSEKPAPDVMLVAIPTRPELRRWPEYLQSSRSDADGHYEFLDLIPGDYEIFALPRGSEESPWAPDFAERHHRSAEHVTIDPHGSTTLILKMTPRDRQF